MSTIVHDVSYSASGGGTQAQHDPSASVQCVVGYNTDLGVYGGSGSGGYTGMCTIAYHHQQPQQHHHQQQLYHQHQQALIKTECDQGLGGLQHQHHNYALAPDMRACQSHYTQAAPEVQQLQLPLIEPLLQPQQQQQLPHRQQQEQTVSVAASDTTSSPDEGNLIVCQGGGSGGGGGASKKRRNPPTTAAGRRSLKTERVNPEESQRREKRRERNRVAAAKCRKKRQDRIECLSEAVRDLEADNAELEATVTQLMGRWSHLVSEVRSHRLRCPDAAQLAAAVDALPPPLPPPPMRVPQMSLSATTVSGGDGNSTDGFGDLDEEESESNPSHGGGGLDSSFGSGGIRAAFEAPQQLPGVDSGFPQQHHHGQLIGTAPAEASGVGNFMRL